MKQEPGKNRIHDCLIVSCCKHFIDVGIPVEFAAPCVYVLLGSVVGRKLFLYTKRQYAFLNSFRFLISGPGGGKSLAIDFVRQVIDQARIKVPVMSSSVTKASMVDELGKDESRTQLGRDATERINQSTVLASEYGILVGEHVHADWFHTLCDLFDGRSYTETRRMKTEPVVIHNPYLNMLAGTQPMHWGKQFPREAWSLGYASRCDFYFADVQDSDFEFFKDQRPPSVEASEGVHPTIREFAHDLQCIHASVLSKLATQILWEAKAARFIESWATDTRKATEFKDPWLQDYNQRRLFRLWRDCALAALARKDFNGEINPQDFTTAYNIFDPQEELLVEHLHRSVNAGESDVLDKIWSWSVTVFFKTRAPIPYSNLLNFVTKQVDTYKARNIIDNLCDTGALAKVESYTRPDGIKVNLSVPEFIPNTKWKTDLAS